MQHQQLDHQERVIEKQVSHLQFSVKWAAFNPYIIYNIIWKNDQTYFKHFLTKHMKGLK